MNRKLTIAAAALLVTGTIWSTSAVSAKHEITTSPLPPEMYGALRHAQSQMKSGKFTQATQSIGDMLTSANDVQKCLEIASATETYGFPMMEARRACLNRALGLCNGNDDVILVALKSRQYQFFEITRQCVNTLVGNSKTVPQLYDLARKCQEVSLNDVSHLAMEKAYTGLTGKGLEAPFEYAEQCKALGMEDLLRKTVKDILDETEDVTGICDLLIRCDGYKLRDLTRYGLRKALDVCASVPDMEAIFVTARQLNEPDIANRANYFVRRGKVIDKIKNDRVNYEAQLRAWREGIDVETARQQAGLAPDGSSNGGGGVSRRAADPPTSGF
jgi:hypothetical protein